MTAILPGGTIGIFGGGQLCRMIAMAARALGYHIRALDPDPGCAARFVVDRCFTGWLDDTALAEEMARGCDVVTLEIEKVSLASLDAAARHAPVRPSSTVLAVIQDRCAQRAWLGTHGFPTGPWRSAHSVGELETAISELGGSCFVKAARGGYDGRGQFEVDSKWDAARAFEGLGNSPVLVEGALALQAELSVLVARNPSGECAVYPPALNHHVNRILDWSLIPGSFPPELIREATEISTGIATALRIEGLLVVELFWSNGRLLVNELAPRPHNSFHATEVACLTSQFEQLVRAICDLPLGSTEVTRPAAIVNLLGEFWVDGKPPPFARALAIPGVRVHLYGKRVVRPGRKMGHLSAVGLTPDEAVRKVEQARALLAHPQT